MGFFEGGVDHREHTFGTFIGIDLSHLAEIAVVIDYWHGIIHVRSETLFEALEIVVRSTTSGLSAFEASFDALVLRAVEEQNEHEVDLLRHLASPALQVVFVTWKAVNQEFVVAGFLQVDASHCITKSINHDPVDVTTIVVANYLLRLDHRVLEETAGDFHGHDFSVRNVLLDKRSELGALPCSFFAQQVTSRKMSESIGLDDLLALGSLAGT